MAEIWKWWCVILEQYAINKGKRSGQNKGYQWCITISKVTNTGSHTLCLPEKTVTIRGLSLFLSRSITPGGRVSRFFSRNPVASYSTCRSQHRIKYNNAVSHLPLPTQGVINFLLTSKTSLTVCVSTFVKSGKVVSLNIEDRPKCSLRRSRGEHWGRGETKLTVSCGTSH